MRMPAGLGCCFEIGAGWPMTMDGAAAGAGAAAGGAAVDFSTRLAIGSACLASTGTGFGSGLASTDLVSAGLVSTGFTSTGLDGSTPAGSTDRAAASAGRGRGIGLVTAATGAGGGGNVTTEPPNIGDG